MRTGSSRSARLQKSLAGMAGLGGDAWPQMTQVCSEKVLSSLQNIPCTVVPSAREAPCCCCTCTDKGISLY